MVAMVDGAFDSAVAKVDASAIKEFYVLRVETPRTRAPHLLLKMSTGHFSVRLNRFIPKPHAELLGTPGGGHVML